MGREEEEWKMIPTVETFNNGHAGSSHFVLYREFVLMFKCTSIIENATSKCLYSKCLLSELYRS